MKITASNLLRCAALSAMVAGIIFAVVGLIHPPQIVSSVTTSTWTIVHLLTIAMSFFGLLGITGIYARQAERAGWMGLAGFLLLSLWFLLVTGFTFFEVFILRLLAPEFAQSFLGIFTGSVGDANVGALSTLWSLLGVVYILGGLLFGIATYRAGILSRWAGALLALGAVASPAFALLPQSFAPLAAVPVGLGLAWMGFSLWSEQRSRTSQPVVPAAGPAVLSPTSAA